MSIADLAKLNRDEVISLLLTLNNISMLEQLAQS